MLSTAKIARIDLERLWDLGLGTRVRTDPYLPTENLEPQFVDENPEALTQWVVA